MAAIPCPRTESVNVVSDWTLAGGHGLSEDQRDDHGIPCFELAAFGTERGSDVAGEEKRR